MPNHCSNTLRICGTEKEISKLQKFVEITKSEATEQHNATEFSCQRILPRPISKDSDWYDWNINNWGSKWDCYDVDVDDSQAEQGYLVYNFSTAWSPINNVIHKLANKFKKLEFNYSYYETGSDFWGYVNMKNGLITDSADGELSTAPCTIKQEYLGEYHNFCSECQDMFECYNNICETDNVLCQECVKDLEQIDMDSWETNDETTKENINA